MSAISKYRGSLAASYEDYCARHPEMTLEDRGQLAAEFARLAITTWLTEAILCIRSYISVWLADARPVLLPECIEQLEHVASDFDQFAQEVQGVYGNLNLGEIPEESLLPTIRLWVETLNVMIDHFDLAASLPSGKEELHGVILNRMVELHDDMQETLPILERLV